MLNSEKNRSSRKATIKEFSQLNFSETAIVNFIKQGIKKHKIKETPLLGQLYFLFYLILNRKEFKFDFKDRMLHCINRCFTKKCFSGLRCPKRFQKAERRNQLFKRGKEKLTRDLDIVQLIKREQMHDVNK